MFIITNRRVRPGRHDLDLLDKTPNEQGPNELRVLEARKLRGKWKLDLIEDHLSTERKKHLGLPLRQKAPGSRYVAQELLSRVRKGKRNLVFFVHGFNNDVEAVLERAARIERTYGVEVIAFSWPANGGGARGVLSYKSDKRDARASAGALYRALGKAREYLDEFNRELLEDVQRRALENFPDDVERRHDYVTRAAEKGCPFKVTLLLHSMGNYLFKQVQSSSVYDEHHMLFDNVVLVAADCNNRRHPDWVDRIRCRRRVFVVINENDGALLASRIKSGEEQRARLGHYLHRLDARQALYVDVTDAPSVGRDHAYFEGSPVRTKNGRLRRFFEDALNGRDGERHLRHRPENGTFRA